MVEKRAKLQQQEAAPKRAEKTRMAAPKCATEKKFCIYVGPNLLTYKDGRTTDSGINDFSPTGFIR